MITTVSYWIDRIDETRAIERRDWNSAIQGLIADGIFDPGDEDQFNIDFRNTKRTSATDPA